MLRRALSFFAVVLVVACNSVLDIPEAHPKTSIGPDPTPTGDDDDNTNPKPTDCGTCNLPHAQSTCNNGACAIASCEGNFKDCNGRADDGCEADISTDRQNCSRCGLACGAGLACEESICRCHEDADCGDQGACGTDPDDLGRCYCGSAQVCGVGSACDGHKCVFLE